MYAEVRTRSVLRKAVEHAIEAGELLPPASPVELNLMLKIALLGDQLHLACSGLPRGSWRAC